MIPLAKNLLTMIPLAKNLLTMIPLAKNILTISADRTDRDSCCKLLERQVASNNKSPGWLKQNMFFKSKMPRKKNNKTFLF
jgi:hypothetical protein